MSPVIHVTTLLFMNFADIRVFTESRDGMKLRRLAEEARQQ